MVACGISICQLSFTLAFFSVPFQILGEALILPESPRFFVQHGREQDAAASLRRLGTTDPVAVAAIIEEFKAEQEQYVDLNAGSEEKRSWKKSWWQVCGGKEVSM